MKTLVMIFLAGALALTPSSSDGNHHVLVKQWKTYEAARNSDKPLDALEALADIKKEAFKQRLSWDYYDAGQQFVDVSCYRNWKLRDSLQTRFKQEIMEYGGAISTFYFSLRNGGEDLERIIRESGKELREGRNEGFYYDAGLGLEYSEFIINHIDNDYEFALWQLFSRNRSAQLLSGELSGIKKGLLEYYQAADLEAFAKEHQGQAVALAARGRLLQERFSQLKDGNKPSADFKVLRNDCEAFENERKAFKGEEKELADLIQHAKYLIEDLDSKRVCSSVCGDTLSVAFQNLSDATVSIEADGKSVFSKKVANTIESYYVEDTVKCVLPAINDGDYIIKTVKGNIKEEAVFCKRTLSLLLRKTSSGEAVFVADCRTGKPVDKVNISILKKSKEIFRQEGLVLNGFTPLPSGAVKALGEKYCSIVCDYTDAKGIIHKSQEMRSDYAGYSSEDKRSTNFVKVITDCGAYHRNDTVRFKAVLYSGCPTERYSILEKGTGIEAVFYDSQFKEISRKSLTLSEFGSAAGEFQIPSNRRNGEYAIDILLAGKDLGHTKFRVDDFVLPSFEILFDDCSRDYLPGETVTVSGKINSYSGHKLSSAKVTAEVSGEETVIKVQTDGTFSIDYQTSDKNSYQNLFFFVKVTDASGESLEASKRVSVSSWLNLNLSLENKAEGECDVKNADCEIIDGNLAKVRVDCKRVEGLSGFYTLSKDGKTVSEGPAAAPGLLELPLEGPSGLYSLTVTIRTKDRKEEKEDFNILKIGASDVSLGSSGIENVFMALKGDNPTVRFGSSEAPLWVVVDLVAADGRLLASDLVSTKKGELHTIEYKYRQEFGHAVTIYLSYFRNCRHYCYSYSYRYESHELELPLVFSRFEDKGVPGTEYRFRLKTSPGTECAISVFDKSTEAIRRNVWDKVMLWAPSAPRLDYGVECGNESSEILYAFKGARSTKAFGAAVAMNSGMVLQETMMDSFELSDTEEQESIAFQLKEEDKEPAIRQDFRAALAFEPFLRSDADGNAEFSFRTSDKLSTFIVQAFAHDLHMRNAVLRKEMVVSVPVKVSLYEPQYLYCGDKYTVKATVSSNADTEIEGALSITVFEGAQREKVFSESKRTLSLAPGEQAGGELTVDVPAAQQIGILVSFASQGQGGDALYVSVPVKMPVQELKEAYSAVLLSGADREALIEELRSRFVNTSGADASLREINILEMVKEAIPQTFDADAKDLVSLSGNWMGALLARSIGGGSDANLALMEKKILACKCDDGGFAWFEGFDSSPLLTTMLLQRLWFIGERGLESGLSEFAPEAVRYLDKQYFSKKERPFWLGGISLEQYLLVRSMYSSIPLEGVGAKELKEFRKEAKAYLLPREKRGLNGALLDKSRRTLTLSLLSESPAGGFDAGVGNSGKLLKSRDADLASLLQYAVAHPSGGTYFPNAVMPWRGLMESELSAHSLLCKLFSESGCNEVADGLRLWMMVQKETQQWKSDPGFIEALCCVLDGSERVLDTKVLTVSKEYALLFEDIKAFGNGFSVKTTYLRDGKELCEGDSLYVGDRIQARYSVWSEENRSFVRLSVARPACFRPVDQTSGRTGFWAYQGYRNVLFDKTEYWFESYPEEKTTIEESLYVTQQGFFQSPAAEIESLYAPHYRAADEARGFEVRKGN